MLGKKDLLWECISRMRKRHKAAYNIAPKTFILPDDYEDFE